MTLIRLADVQPERVSWLWPGRIPLGKLTILDGDGGLGKSTVLLDLAARLSTGEPLPDGPALERAGTVLLSIEDGLADTTRPRLDAAGADLTRIVALTDVPDEHGNPQLPSIPEDIDAIERAIMTVDARFVVIDPVMSYLSGGTNSHADHEVRRALTPLASLAERSGAAIVVVRHLNKTAGGKAIYRGNGSIAFIGIARAGLIIAEDPDDEFRRVLAVSKTNLGPRPVSLAYRLVDNGAGVARVSWEGISHHHADDLLAQRDEEERSDMSDAEAFLRDALAQGARPAADLITEARRLSISERTLRNVKARLHIKSEKEHRGGGQWVWYIPPPPEDCRAPAIPQPLQPLQPLQPSRERESETLKDAKYVKAAKAGGMGQVASFVAAFPLATTNGKQACAHCGKAAYMVINAPQLCSDCKGKAGYFQHASD